MASSTRFALALAVAAACFGPREAAAQPALAFQPLQPVTPADMICVPEVAAAAPSGTMHLLGTQEGPVRQMAGPGDAVVLDAGTAKGVEVGQRFLVRRSVRTMMRPTLGGSLAYGIVTAGTVRVVSVQEHIAIGIVEQGCDAVTAGDYLVSFTEPTPFESAPAGQPDYANPAHVVFSRDGKDVAATFDTMVIDRGSAQGVRPGQRLTIYRELAAPGGAVLDVGEAIVLIVSADTSMIRIDRARDAVYVGDRAAFQR